MEIFNFAGSEISG